MSAFPLYISRQELNLKKCTCNYAIQNAPLTFPIFYVGLYECNMR